MTSNFFKTKGTEKPYDHFFLLFICLGKVKSKIPIESYVIIKYH